MNKKIILTLLVCSIFTKSFAINNASAAISSEVVSVDSNSDDTKTSPEATEEQNSIISNMLLQSIGLMGIAYKWGGNTPKTGMDCSGFVKYVFKQSLGIDLPRTAAEMSKIGKKVTLDKLQPGDLVFFNTFRGSNTHIGIYIGDNKFIQAPRTGENIQISTLNAYWKSKFNGAKRIVQEDTDQDGNTVVEDYSDVTSEALPFKYKAKRHVVRKASKNKSTKKSAKSTKSSQNVKAKKTSKSVKPSAKVATSKKKPIAQ